MKFELKNVSHNATLSEETLCFSAVLYIDGKKAFEVSNRGHGGCDDVRQVGSITLDEVNRWLEANRPRFGLDINPEGLPHDLEIEVGELMNRWLARKEIMSMCSRKLVTVKDGKIYTRGKMVSNKLTPAQVAKVEAQLAPLGEKLVTKAQNLDLAIEAVMA